MAIPNELTKYLFPIHEVLLDYSIESDQEMSVKNASIIIGKDLYWCMGKHSKYDRLKNNSERLLSHKTYREIEFDTSYIGDIAYGNLEEPNKLVLYTGRRNTCSKCRERFIKFDIEWGKITPFCVHKIKRVIFN